MAEYLITINLDDDTLEKLYATDQYLRAYKGVKAKIEAGLCPLWFATKDFSNVVKISWEERYGGYVDSQEFGPDLVIDASSVQPMELSERMVVHDSGKTALDRKGTPGAIDIHNDGSKEWTCGMGQMVQGELSPICAFQLFGGYTDLMMPYEEVLLVFESGQIDTGTVVEETISPSITITLTGDDREREVSFSINERWEPKDAAWAEISEETINLADKLIHKM